MGRYVGTTPASSPAAKGRRAAGSFLGVGRQKAVARRERIDDKSVADLSNLSGLVEAILRRIHDLAENTGRPSLHFFLLEHLKLPSTNAPTTGSDPANEDRMTRQIYLDHVYKIADLIWYDCDKLD